jgi:hypothetical protein
MSEEKRIRGLCSGASVVVAQLSVNQLERVRFPDSPQNNKELRCGLSVAVAPEIVILLVWVQLP